MKEIVSIIIPVYNAELYLKQCLDSVIAQSYENIEILCVDDGSKDGSSAILDNYAIKDSRIKVIHKPNGGAGSAINAALDIMTGSYVMFADNDDWVDPDYVAFLLEKIQTYHLDMACCTGTDYYEGTDQRVFLDGHQDCFFDDHEACRDILSQHQFTTEAMMKKIYRAELWNDMRCLNNRNYQDTYMFLKMLPRMKKIGYFNESKYNYRVRQGSICRSGYQKYSIQQVFAYTDNYDLIKTQYPESLPLLKHNIVSVAMTNYIRLVLENKQLEYSDDAVFYRQLWKKYKPIFSWDKSKLALYAMWVLSKGNSGILDRFILANRKKAAAVMNIDTGGDK